VTTFHWVRHGPTHEKAFVGWRDVPADLSDHARIARLSAALPDRALVISSDLVRASATADALMTSARTRLPHDERLREFNLGEWDGLRFPAVAERDPELSRVYWEDPGDVAPPGGESWNAAARRINAAVDALVAAHPEAEIVAVAHIGVILSQVQRARGVMPKAALEQTIDNLSLTRVRTGPDGWHLDAVNLTP
jgi:alpha-ribazole phosphatase